MPIKPENKARYPRDWPDIRARILRRAGNRCEWCGVENHAWGWRDDNGKFQELDKDHLKKQGYVRPPFRLTMAENDWEPTKIIMVVLTIAHIHNHDPADCRDENLAALCQRCHNRHDATMRRKNAFDTIRKKKAVNDLFNTGD